MKGLRGWKLWVFLGVSLALGFGAFVFQSSGPSETEAPVVEGLDEDLEGMVEEGGGLSLATDELGVGPVPVEFVEPGVEAPAESGSVEGMASAEAVEPGVEAPAESGSVEGMASAEAVEPGVEAPAEAVEPVAVAEDLGLPAEIIEPPTEVSVEVVEVAADVRREVGVNVARRRIEFEVGSREGNEVVGEGSEAVLEAAFDAELEAAWRVEAEAVSGVDVEGVDTAAGVLEGRRVLALRVVVPEAREGVRVLRGSLGYRVPLVVRQEVPDQIRGGVYIPGHTTYVIVRQGHWRVEQLGGDLMGMDVAPAEAGNAPVVEEEKPRHILPWLRQKFGRRERRDDGGTE